MRYEQTTGKLTDAEGKLLGTGYSGRSVGRNNPEMDDAEGIGPLPRGRYMMKAVVECTKLPCHNCDGTARHEHGPYVIRLVPDAANEMHGRAGFLMHGDNANHDASEGCIIMPYSTRVAVSTGADRLVDVV